MERLILLHSQQLLVVEGIQGLVAATKAGKRGVLYIAFFNEERPLPYEENHLFAVALRSSHGVSLAKCLIHMVRDHEIPVVVLPKGHPSLKRFPLLLAVAREVRLSSRIQGGAVPTAGLLCAPSKEFDNLLLVSAEEGIVVKGLSEHLSVRVEEL